MPTTQISAHIPEELKARLDRYVRAHGVTRAHLIEQALQHHLQAMEELPPEAIVPTRVVLTARSAKRVREVVERPPKPTRAMKALFHDR